jgi:predicted dehydrogenase
MSTTPLNGALIGAGNVTPFHWQAWERIPQASIVAIADPDLDKARTRVREFGI